MKKLSCTDPTDSRLVWKDLTEAILADNDQAAGEAKHQVHIPYFTIILASIIKQKHYVLKELTIKM